MSEPTPVHPIRQRLIDDMTLHGFTAPTQKGYIRTVRNCLSVISIGVTDLSATELALRRAEAYVACGPTTEPSRLFLPGSRRRPCQRGRELSTRTPPPSSSAVQLAVYEILLVRGVALSVHMWGDHAVAKRADFLDLALDHVTGLDCLASLERATPAYSARADKFARIKRGSFGEEG